MRELLIDIHYPSCKSFGFSSEEFENALKLKFSNTDYKLKIDFSGSSIAGYYPSGYSKLAVVNERDGELDMISAIVSQVFNSLAETVRTKT